jgi:hypothetical protein
MEKLVEKFSSRMVWLYALGAVAVGIGLSLALQGVSGKASAAAFGGVMVLAGVLSTLTTKASTGRAILVFLVTGVLAAIAAYVVVSQVIGSATTQLATAASLGKQQVAAAHAGGVMGTFFGVFAAIVALLETFIGGLIGALVGARMKAQVQSGQPLGRTRSSISICL